MDDNVLVSVIVPVYNVKRYVEESLNSILKQTYHNIEVIVVDDGSTDGSGEICDIIAKSDKRLRVFHQENMGLSGARNTGLQNMKGDYLTFVDSDDTIEPVMIEKMLDLAFKFEADIVQCGLNEIYFDKCLKSGVVKEITFFTPEQATIADLGLEGGTVSACAKLYKKEIFEGRLFKTGRLNEDLFAIMDSLNRAKKIIACPDAYYNYFQRMGSITKSKFNERTIDNMIAARYCLDFVKEHYPSAVQAAEFRYFWSCIYVVDRILLSKDWKTNRHLGNIVSELKSNIIKVLRFKKLTLKRKFGIIMMVTNIEAYRLFVLRNYGKQWGQD